MRNLATVLACSALMTFAIGCSNSPGIVRGQNPMVQQAGGSAGASYNCPPYAHGNCPNCPHSGGSDHWRPTHHHTFEYNPPKGLKYPAQNQPPGVYQYPYYTVKGPTDFFYE